MSHSPGPFRVGGEYDRNRDEIEAADGRCIALVWTRKASQYASARSQFKDDPEGKANFHLFAAAPELLAACRSLLDMITDNRLHGPEIDVAVAAIGKAVQE